MKKLTGILLAVCMAASLLIGCGQKAANQSTQTTESQTATVQTEISGESSEEVSDVQHCLLLAGKNGTWLLADRENGNSEWRVLLLACRNHCFIVEHML